MSGNKIAIAITAVVCLAAGAVGGSWFRQQRDTPKSSGAPAAPLAAPLRSAQAPEKVMVSVPSDAVQRMGLEFATVAFDTEGRELRVPGTVEPNGYREVAVTPIASGIVSEVIAELGQPVRRGQRMASIFSQELADAQTTLIGMNADLDVSHKKMQRTDELVRLGAASRQELEEVQGEHQSHNAHLEQARQKLILLGLTPEQVSKIQEGGQVSSLVNVPAPIDGVVLSRSVNLGQVVATGQELFKVTDLSSVWVEANLLEDYFALVRKGSQAIISTQAYPNRTYRGTVDYIDPRVDPQTRTAKVRVTVANSDQALRLGMYADIVFLTTEGAPVAVVPASAVQRVGTTAVAYVPVEGRKDQFEQRPLTVGSETSLGVQILSGLKPGEKVVTSGSFLLRAEAIRTQ
jgi:RND family efflux transporter MFP subunit